MSELLSPADAGKFAAAMASIAEVQPDMVVGLGTGSTANWMVRALAKRGMDEVLNLTCVPTSQKTDQLARALGFNVVGLDDVARIDLTIDGADEFDARLRLIKGGGGAHLREKLVAASSDRMVVITDPSKDVAHLGKFPLPIEVVPFGLNTTRARIEAVLAEADVDGRDLTLRMAGNKPFVTDEGNHIFDAHLDRIGKPQALAAALDSVTGMVEHGLFLRLCDTVIIGHPDGRSETRRRKGKPVWGEVDMALAATLPNAN